MKNMKLLHMNEFRLNQRDHVSAVNIPKIGQAHTDMSYG